MRSFRTPAGPAPCPWLLLLLLLAAGCARLGFGLPASDVGQADGAADSALADGSVRPLLEGGADPGARVLVSALRVAWTTPHWAHWTWRTQGMARDLEALEFVLAQTAAEVLSRTGDSVRISRYERGALGLSDDDPLGGLDRTMVGRLVPDQTYFGQMTAIDVRGLRSATDVVEAHTTGMPQRELVIFADEDTAGYSIPAGLVRSDRAPHAGTHHYEWTASCAQPTCYEILRRQSLKLALDSIDRQSFDSTAFFELALASNSTVPWQTRLRIWFGTDEDHEGLLTEFGYWPVPVDDAYHVYEIPLRALGDEAGPVAHETVVRGLFELGVDGTWSSGSTTRLDEWRIRW